jgi:branched-chain amino acid transport system permease protein
VTTAQIVQFTFSGLTLGCIYALIALGFTIIFNATGIVNFAQGDFAMLGAMFSATFSTAFGLPLPLAVLLAVLAVATIGGVMERLLIRSTTQDRTLFVPVMMTMGASIVFNAIAVLLWGADPLPAPAFSGERPIHLFGATLVPQMIWIGAVLLAVTVALFALFKFTRVGQAMLAASMNPDAAAALGVNVPQMAWLSFVFAAALGGIGGVLVAPITMATYDMSGMMTLKGFTAAVLGGLGSIPGALVGGLVLGLLESMSSGVISSGYRDAVVLGVLLAVLMLKPSGLIGAKAVKH